MSTPTLEHTGFVYGMPEKDYHAHPALGSTSLKLLSDPDLSLAEAKYQMEHDEHKEVYEVGTLGHALILEGSYDHLIHRVEGVEKYLTKDAKAQRDWALNEGLIPINDSEVESKLQLVHDIRDSVMAHPIAKDLLQAGQPEVLLLVVGADLGVQAPLLLVEEHVVELGLRLQGLEGRLVGVGGLALAVGLLEQRL